jgi:CheY-like chemotaxis protein
MPQTQEPESWTGTGTALLVDDEAPVREMAERMLEVLGFSVLVAENGRAGVELFREHLDELSVVVLDLTMPELSGEETLRQMRAVDAEVPIVITSGYDEQQATERVGRLGSSGFLQKPFRLAALRRVLSAAIEARPPDS